MNAFVFTKWYNKGGCRKYATEILQKEIKRQYWKFFR